MIKNIIRFKIIATLFSISILFLIVMYVMAYHVLLKDSFNNENKHAKEDVILIKSYIEDKLDDLAVLASEWSSRRAAYTYIKEHNQSFVYTKLTNDYMAKLNLTFMAFIDGQGNVLHIQMKTENLCNMSAADAAQVLDKYRLLKSSYQNISEIKGLISSGKNLMYFVEEPIKEKNSTQRVIGSLIFGRCFSFSRGGSLVLLDHDSLSLSVIDPTKIDPALDQILRGFNGRDYYLKQDSSLSISSYLLLKDIKGQAVAVLQNKEKMEMYSEALKSFRYFAFGIILWGLVMTVVFAILLDVVFIRRLTKIRDAVIDISKAADMSLRLELTGNDELSYLVRMINQMLDTLEKTQQEISRQQKLEGIVEVGGTICHEINQPLTALTGYVDILLMKLTPEQVWVIERVNRIKIEAIRMGDLTRKLNNVLRKKEFITKEYIKDVRILDIHREE